MEHLFEKWAEWDQKLRSDFIFLFADYDGTLTPIAESPDKAVLSGRMRDLLDKFSNSNQCSLAIISGRTLDDLKKQIGLKNIFYAGNHGLEIEGPDIKFTVPVPAELRKMIKTIYKEISQSLSCIKGIYIEDKGLTISLHYRSADIKDIPRVLDILSQVTGPYVQGNKIKVSYGKKVYEIKPAVKWDKGEVVSWLYSRQFSAAQKNKAIPVYIGDDLTDEDAFKVVKDKGLTVFVGKPGVSRAKYYLKDVNEVLDFIGRIVTLKNE